MAIPGLFITATDTDAGKTFVTALIARQLVAEGLRVGAYKPACSGAEVDADGRPVWGDVQTLARAIGGVSDDDLISPQRFQAPYAPPIAAELENREVDAALLRVGLSHWLTRADFLLIEGVGGLLCPIAEDETIADLAGDFGFSLIIVSRAGLGTINHTLLTVEVAKGRGLPIAGIVFNDPRGTINPTMATAERAEFSRRCDVPILAVVAHEQTDFIHDDSGCAINWQKLARK